MPAAIVTGAARGIGAAVCRALRADGYDIVAVDRCTNDERLDYNLGTEAELRAVAEEVDGSFVIGDVALQETNDRAAQIALESHGSIGAAVACAGVIAGAEPAWLVSDEAFDVMFDVNVRAVLSLARSAIPAMMGRDEPRHGRFVAISSAAALKATPSLATYAASKAAVIGLVRSLAADLGDTGITANVIQPGSTTTSLLERSAKIYDIDVDEFARHHLNDALLQPEQVAAAVSFLCSEAASGITGSALPVDGGMTAS